ncbi:MAG: hypothetical protein HY719_00645, partial [Planctomycetes bacterium]|nr:hypothetical protein [Planctomycetota bacterium]
MTPAIDLSRDYAALVDDAVALAARALGRGDRAAAAAAYVRASDLYLLWADATPTRA